MSNIINPPHKVVPSYDGLRDTTHFITVTLDPRYYKLTMREQYRKSFNKLNKLLSQFTIKHLLVCEMTKQANVHFHGIVKWEDESMSQHFFFESLKRNEIYGRSESQIIKGDTYSYITKDINTTYKLLNHNKNKMVLSVWSYRQEEQKRFRLPCFKITDIAKLDNDIIEDNNDTAVIVVLRTRTGPDPPSNKGAGNYPVL